MTNTTLFIISKLFILWLNLSRDELLFPATTLLWQ